MRPDQTDGHAVTVGDPARQTSSGPPVELALPSARDAPATARAAISAGMAAHVTDSVLADALLLVAELVTNSVRHAQAPADALIGVRAELRHEVLRLEVADRGIGGSVARRAPDLEHGGGFGLNLVETLSACWGVDRDGGTRVWAELARTPSPPKHTTIDDNAVREHDHQHRARTDAATLTRRVHAATRHAAAAVEAVARAKENARRARDRCAQLRAQAGLHAGRADSGPCPSEQAA